MNNVVSSKQARQQFAEILNQVMYAGREFVISRFNKPVAKISPIKSVSEDEEIARRKKAVAQIIKLREKLNAKNLTEIVIRERDKEYRRWKKLSSTRRS